MSNDLMTQYQRKGSLGASAPPPTIDVEKGEPLLGVIVQSPQASANAGTGQTPVIVRTLGEQDNNPYAERGFKRGLEEKPTITKFLCCYSLNFGILLSSFYDVIQGMVWLVLIFVDGGSIQWPFHLIYFLLCAGRLFFFWRFNRIDSEVNRQQLYQAHLASTIALSVIYFLQFVVTLIEDKQFPAVIFIWSIFSTAFAAYLIVVHRQNWQNFELDQLRAEAYEQSKIDNSGVICAEDLLLSDGITKAWANQGGETKIYDPEKSFSSNSSRGNSSVDYGAGVGPEALQTSYINNTSFDLRMARPSTGSIDQMMTMDGEDAVDNSTSVKIVQNQQIVEADNCCF